MNITINLPPGSEVLTQDEIMEITGRLQYKQQRDWLDGNGWRYFVTAQGMPIVGRLYARFVMAGVEQNALTFTSKSDAKV